MADSLDDYTLSAIRKIIELKKLKVHLVPHESLDFLDGFVYALLWMEDELIGLQRAKKEEG